MLVHGRSISPGVAAGYALVWSPDAVKIPLRRLSSEEVGRELEKFRRALAQSHGELQRLSERVESELGSAEAEIFSAHLLFLKDPQFTARVETTIEDELVCVESAVSLAIDELAEILRHADNEYLREREEDLRDLKRRVIRHITQQAIPQLSKVDPQTVLVARELLPSDLLHIDRQNLAGIITEVGGEAGHAAILARSLGVPAITGVVDATHIAQPGMRVLLDGRNGEVVFDPSPGRLRLFAPMLAEYDRSVAAAESVDRLACITRDGQRISLLANIGRENEAGLVRKNYLESVGLFRTELLFLDSLQPPSLDRQRELYRRIAQDLRGGSLVIRTLDLGGDKFPVFLAPRFEANPNLGVRGLRFSLVGTERLFRTQIRAILQISRECDVKILLPMVIGGSDMRDALTLIRQIAQEEGLSDLPPVGALVETPSAVFSIEEILNQADFLSIGTNDLTQFILAADRNALATFDDYSVLHPSVLRAIHHVVEAADKAGKPVSVCGEVAADPRTACLLIGLGVRALSMSPLSASQVRFAIRAMSLETLNGVAKAALSSESPRLVSALLNQRLEKPLSAILSGSTADNYTG